MSALLSRMTPLVLLCLIAAACGGASVETATTTVPEGLASTEVEESSSTTSPVTYDTVVVAARDNIDASPLWIADSEGFFEKNGIEVEFLAVSQEDELFDSLLRGQADVIVVSSSTALRRATVNRADLEFLVYLDGTQGGLYEERGSMSLIAPVGSNIRTGCDLEGIRIGVDSVSSLAAVALREMVIVDGCAPEQLRLFPSDSPSMINDLRTGQLDAAVLGDPYTTRAIRAKNEIIANLDNSLCPDWGSCPLSVVAGDRNWGDDNPELKSRFEKALVETIRWIRVNELEYRAELVQCCALTPDDAGDIRVPNFVGDRRDLRSDIGRLVDIMASQRQLSDRTIVDQLLGDE